MEMFTTMKKEIILPQIVAIVMIDDPTTGYGIFIENMLNQMGNPAS